MLIAKTIEIDMGHRVPNHKSKCKNLHGHRYAIEVGVDDKLIKDQGSSSEGMVIDYGDLKEQLMQLDEIFDHSFTIYKNDSFISHFEMMKGAGMKINIVEFIPTAENLAEFWYQIIKHSLNAVGIKIKYLKVWETPTSTAIYEEK